MNWKKLEASLIRAFWTMVFPGIGFALDWALRDGNLQSIGVEDTAYIAVFSAVAYGLKKYFFPDTKF